MQYINVIWNQKLLNQQTILKKYLNINVFCKCYAQNCTQMYIWKWIQKAEKQQNEQ